MGRNCLAAWRARRSPSRPSVCLRPASPARPCRGARKAPGQWSSRQRAPRGRAVRPLDRTRPVAVASPDPVADNDHPRKNHEGRAKQEQRNNTGTANAQPSCFRSSLSNMRSNVQRSIGAQAVLSAIWPSRRVKDASGYRRGLRLGGGHITGCYVGLWHLLLLATVLFYRQNR
jgi:hypothetical protein